MRRHAESFRDLIVYQKARQVARQFFDLSQAFPKESTLCTDHRLRITNHLSSY